jgi:flagellar biosynthesis/type III secretory pathway protein FliH
LIETKGRAQQRKAWKFRLTKMLYERGYERQQILDLYRFVDWLIILPEMLEREFWQELQTFEEDRKVTYVTNAERFGFERGIQEGRQKGRQEGRQEGLDRERALILRQLTRRLGLIAPAQETQVRSLSLTQLEDLGEALLDFTKPTDLKNWLQTHQ